MQTTRQPLKGASFADKLGAKHPQTLRAAEWADRDVEASDEHKGLSVRLQFSQEERWTTAFKYLLQNLKWLLTWHSAG